MVKVVKKDIQNITVVGGGFTGLTIAYELLKKGFKVDILEAENELGGLASSFNLGDEKLERFYHHWFSSDKDVMSLMKELNLYKNLIISPTNTGVYYANNFFQLSTPLNLLNFKPLKFFNRIRLGLFTLRARNIKNWAELENLTANEWIKSLGGEQVYKIVWEPLLKGKFGDYAKDISAVWFWNKLKLRGGSRSRSGREELAYPEGGFVTLVDALLKKIEILGGKVYKNSGVDKVEYLNGNWIATTQSGIVHSDCIIITTALPIIADMIRSWADKKYLEKLERIKYLANVCLILELDRPLSETYWLNVNDPSFPFVGVIEHTNFIDSKKYQDKHIIYISKYLHHEDLIYAMDSEEYCNFALPFLQRMFPNFSKDWILDKNLWRARWAQPVVEKNYSKLIPPKEGPKQGFYVCSMAQIYPEDRGTNYAVKEAKDLVRRFF